MSGFWISWNHNVKTLVQTDIHDRSSVVSNKENYYSTAATRSYRIGTLLHTRSLAEFSWVVTTQRNSTWLFTAIKIKNHRKSHLLVGRAARILIGYGCLVGNKVYYYSATELHPAVKFEFLNININTKIPLL